MYYHTESRKIWPQLRSVYCNVKRTCVGCALTWVLTLKRMIPCINLIHGSSSLTSNTISSGVTCSKQPVLHGCTILMYWRGEWSAAEKKEFFYFLNARSISRYNPQFLKKTKQVPLNLARQRYPRPSLAELRSAFRTSISFLIVRHPLERLLSGYNDKIQYSLPHTYHRKLGNEIIQKYRSTKTKLTVNYLQFLQKTHKNHKNIFV